MLALLLAAALAPAAAPSPSTTRDTQTVVVRVYDNARVSRSEWREAEKIANEILRPVGVRLTWKACGVMVAGRDPCVDPPEPRELVVRWLGGESDTMSGILGTANVPGILASVFPERVRTIAIRNRKPTGLILGAVMAHEAVHLLLGLRGHTAQGLMRATWSDSDIRLGWIWRIGRTADERAAITAGLHDTLAAAPIELGIRTLSEIEK